MARMTFLLDTNVVSDLLKSNVNVYRRLKTYLQAGEVIYMCPPVYYEALRGLLWVGATAKVRVLQNEFLPLFHWAPLVDEDWTKAAQIWASMVSTGKQLSDIDLLVVVMAQRLDTVIVSSDADFDALPVKRENWRGSFE